MIRASELIAKIANNLNIDLSEDKQEDKQTNALYNKQTPSYNKYHILSYINQAYLILARELRLFKSSVNISLNGDEKIILYPKNYLAIISVRLNNEFIECKSFEYAKSERKKENEVIGVFLDNGFLIEPMKKGELELNYYSFKQVESEEEYLYLNIMHEAALIFYSLFLANQKIMSNDSLELSSYYYRLFLEELKTLRNIISLNQVSKKIRTNFKTV